MTIKALPLRIGVGAIVVNNKNKIFVGKRKDNPVNKWQMPQGGINKNENFLEAAKRELKGRVREIVRATMCFIFRCVWRFSRCSSQTRAFSYSTHEVPNSLL